VTSSRLRAAVLVIAASLLAGCAAESSDGAPCPPVVAYSREFLARAADELASLPAGSANRADARGLPGEARAGKGVAVIQPRGHPSLDSARKVRASRARAPKTAGGRDPAKDRKNAHPQLVGWSFAAAAASAARLLARGARKS
jgi:hypothetical protein